jgi:AraC-like DNA-binding protein
VKSQKQVPSDYAIVLTRWARDQRVDLLAGLQMTQADLESINTIPLSVYVELLQGYSALQTDPDWGFELGQRLSMAHHGPLGFGALSAPTVRDGLSFLARYLPTRTPYANARIELKHNAMHIVFHHDDIMAPFVQRICETLSIVFQTFVDSAGASVAPLVWRFPYAEPVNAVYYRRWLRCDFTFGAPQFRLEVPNSITMIASAFRNDEAYKSAMAQCEALLVDGSTDPLVAKAQRLLASHIERRATESVPVTEIPTAEEIAVRLGVSRRTLIRQLKSTGRSFQGERDAQLKSQLEKLLLQPELTLADIGDRLGYADAANFSRACKRMYGVSPRQLQRHLTSATG